MMIKDRINWFSTVGWFCLLGDGITGLMLLASPLFTLKMMGVNEMPAEPVFIRYIGVFVMCAGLFYGVPRLLRDASERLFAWKTVFICTCMLRLCIAAFVGWALSRGLLGRGWISVPVYDVALAAVQLWVLKRAPAA